MKRYYRIWLIFAATSVQTSLTSRFNAFILILGKLLRFGMFFFFLVIIGARTSAIAGYSLQQIIFFYLTYQLIDTIPQMLMREVYKFRGYVVRGDFDYFLAKPFSPLFRALFAGPDILDVPMIVISLAAIFFLALQMGVLSVTHIFVYLILICNAMLLAIAFHIFVVTMGVITTEVDNAIMLYRDVTQMGRLPIDIYKEPLRGFLTFVIPVAILMTFPAKGMFGLLSTPIIFLSLIVSCSFLGISILLWQYALRHYASASS